MIPEALLAGLVLLGAGIFLGRLTYSRPVWVQSLFDRAQGRHAAAGVAAKPMFLDVTEIIMVVEDLDAAIERQWLEFGIGPWQIWTFDGTTVDEMVLHGQPCDFAVRIGYTKIGNVSWELVEPLDTRSTYYEMLRDHGPCVHNIVFDVADFDAASAQMAEKGYPVFNGGNWKGIQFRNFDTRGALPVVAEIFRVPAGQSFPPPERVYP